METHLQLHQNVGVWFCKLSFDYFVNPYIKNFNFELPNTKQNYINNAKKKSSVEAYINAFL